MVHTQSNWTKQFSVYFQFICVRNFVVCSVAFDSMICRPSVIHFVFQLHMYICKCFGVSQKKPKQILKLKQKLNIILCSFDKEDFKICLFLQQQKTKKKTQPIYHSKYRWQTIKCFVFYIKYSKYASFLTSIIDYAKITWNGYVCTCIYTCIIMVLTLKFWNVKFLFYSTFWLFKFGPYYI